MNPLSYHTPAPGFASRQDVNRASYPYPTEEEDEKTKSDEAAWRWDEVFFKKKMNGDQSVNSGDIYIYHIYISYIYMFKYNIYIYTWYIHYELMILNLENVYMVQLFAGNPTFLPIPLLRRWKHGRCGRNTRGTAPGTALGIAGEYYNVVPQR